MSAIIVISMWALLALLVSAIILDHKGSEKGDYTGVSKLNTTKEQNT